MAVVTAGVVGVATAYGAHRQSRAAEEAAEMQARGVESAQRNTAAATDRARQFLLTGVNNAANEVQMQEQIGVRPPSDSIWNRARQRLYDEQAAQYMDENTPQQTQQQQNYIPGSNNLFRPTVDNGPQQNSPAAPVYQTPNTQGVVDPRQEYLAGTQQGLALTDLGYQTAGQTLSPIAEMAMPYLNEQSALLGMQGAEARDTALANVSDPLVAEQERAFARNNAAFGGVGGNALSALAEQTRNRTEANIGNRLSQLASANMPSLNALQNMSQMQLNRNLDLAGIARTAGGDLASMETNRRRSLANLEVGQGSQMAQLSQNLGNARGNYYAHAAANAPALTQGLMAGLSAYGGSGGFGGGGGGGFGQFLTNISSGYGNIGDPFSG